MDSPWRRVAAATRTFRGDAGGSSVETGARLRYAAPEQLASDDYDASADVYSLGVVLYEMVRPRFGTAMERCKCLGALAASPNADARAALLAEEEAFAALPDAAALLARMLARDPAARPTAADAASSVEHALDRDVVRALKASGKGDATVVLRAPNGDVRVYSDEGVFISEEKARTSSDPAAAPPRAVSDSTS